MYSLGVSYVDARTMEQKGRETWAKTDKKAGHDDMQNQARPLTTF